MLGGLAGFWHQFRRGGGPQAGWLAAIWPWVAPSESRIGGAGAPGKSLGSLAGLS